MNLLSISNDVITTQQKTFTSGDNRIDLVQDISDYFSTLSDCLGKLENNNLMIR